MLSKMQQALIVCGAMAIVEDAKTRAKFRTMLDVIRIENDLSPAFEGGDEKVEADILQALKETFPEYVKVSEGA
jgi:hypothetical protein